MPKSEKTDNSPKSTPKRAPKRAPKSTPKPSPETASIEAPKPRPKRVRTAATILTPIVTPETTTISVYSLIDWETKHSIHSTSYGNGRQQINEFHTEADAKVWLRQNGHVGHFAAVERNNGKIGKSWHFEIEEPEDDFEFEDDQADDFEMLDEDDLDDVPVHTRDLFRAKIRAAKLQAEVETLRSSKNGASSSIGELLDGIKALDEMRGGQKSKGGAVELLAEIRALKELEAALTPKREAQPQPQPAPPQLSNDALILNALASNDAVVGKVKDLMKGMLNGNGAEEKTTFADVVMEAVKNGELASSVKALSAGLQGIVSMILPPKPQTPAARGPIDQVRPAAAVSHSPKEISADESAVNTNQAGLEEDQAEESMDSDAEYESTEDQALRLVIEQAVQSIPVGVAAHRVLALARRIEEEDPGHSIFPYLDLFCQMPVDGVLAFINTLPDGATVTELPHAREWTENLQTELKKRLAGKEGQS